MMDPAFPSPAHGAMSDHPAAMGGVNHPAGGGANPVSAGVCDPHLNGLSLAEMIDHDIKEDFDEVLRNNPIGFSDTLELFNDFDSAEALFKVDGPLGGTSAPSGSGQVHIWSGGGGNNFGDSGLTPVAFNPSYVEDMASASAVMVNPNNVMPVASSGQQLQHQQVQRLSVNTQYSPNHHQSGPNSPMAASPGYSMAHSPIIQQQQQQQHQVFSVQVPQVVTTARVTKTLKVLPPTSSPMQQVPGSPVIHVTTATNSSRKKNPSSGSNSSSNNNSKENGFPKPAYSYSCLIALALKNSQTGSMSVSEIYKFMCEHFPYFKTAPSGWKNSVRHNLSLNKCFEKIEKPQTANNQRKGCLWAMNPNKITKMDEEVQKWSRKDPMAIKKGMANPNNLEFLERGEMVKDYNANSTTSVSSSASANDSEDEDDPRTPTSVSSSQGGYDSAGSDFVDIETFSAIPDSALPELNLQATGGVYEELKSDNRLPGVQTQQLSRQQQQQQQQNLNSGRNSSSSVFFSTSIQGNYSIAPAAATGQQQQLQQQQHKFVLQK